MGEDNAREILEQLIYCRHVPLYSLETSLPNLLGFGDSYFGDQWIGFATKDTVLHRIDILHFFLFSVQQFECTEFVIFQTGMRIKLAGIIHLSIGTEVTRTDEFYSDIWPKPKHYSVKTSSVCALKQTFVFEVDGKGDTSHMQRLGKTTSLINERTHSLLNSFRVNSESGACSVDSCKVIVADPNARMSEDVKSESYTISFTGSSGGECAISCPTAYGCMRGLFTFLDMIDPVANLLVPESFEVADEPEFSHRGLLIDTSRHFIPVSMLKDHLHVMAMTKMNVLHWHIVDDHSFPLKLEGDLELLSRKGAYHFERAVYTKTDVQEIVELANQLGIRVIPELDVPGHTRTWALAFPELWGKADKAIDPTVDANYDFIEKMLAAVKPMFDTDIYEDDRLIVHIGGDEVWGGWDTAGIKDWMTANGMKSKAELVSYWMQHMSGIANRLGIRLTIWDDFLKDVADDVSKFGDNPFIFQTWQMDFPRSVLLADVIQRNVVFSTDFYLDHLHKRWTDFYKVDMSSHSSRLVGGEACMWSESVDASNMFPRVWPRAAAVAERLWCGSHCPTDPKIDAVPRLARWRCRMMEFFGFKSVEPVASEAVNGGQFVYGTEREQWWCRESDLERDDQEMKSVELHVGTEELENSLSVAFA